MNINKWGHNYQIEKKTLWKKKLLATSNLSFSHNVFKSCLLLMRRNEYLWSKGLKTKSKGQILEIPVNNRKWINVVKILR